MYGHPSLGYGFGLEGPYKARRAAKFRRLAVRLLVGFAGVAFAGFTGFFLWGVAHG